MNERIDIENLSNGRIAGKIIVMPDMVEFLIIYGESIAGMEVHCFARVLYRDLKGIHIAPVLGYGCTVPIGQFIHTLYTN